jgi:hypothetical protein
VLQN